MTVILTLQYPDGSRRLLELPAGAQVVRAPEAANSALQQRPDSRWECYSSKLGGALIGYCMSPEYAGLVANGHPIEGITWADIQASWHHHILASILARCPWITEEAWERDRLLRIAHKAKFHAGGHETEDEAIACYQAFLSDFGINETETL